MIGEHLTEAALDDAIQENPLTFEKIESVLRPRALVNHNPASATEAMDCL